MLDGTWYLLLIVAGFIAGIVNTIAGGGSFLTLPALMLFGLDPRIANGTNRLAVLFSSASAVATFQKHGHLNRNDLWIPGRRDGRNRHQIDRVEPVFLDGLISIETSSPSHPSARDRTNSVSG